MGFDDEVFDNEVKEKIIEALKPLIGLYDYEDWDDLEGMEEGDKVYCAYSLIYRQLYNLSEVFFSVFIHHIFNLVMRWLRETS